MEEKDYLKAVDLYQQHLFVFDNDQEVQLKYADALLKLQRTPKHLETALAIYNEILSQKPDRKDVRRLAAEVAIEIGGRRFEMARRHLTTLLKSAKQDGHLEYLMGRCYENDKDAANAVKFYQAAIAHEAPQRLDASQRLAWLLRDPLWQQKESDQLIEAMVNADPDIEPVQRLAELLRDPQSGWRRPIRSSIRWFSLTRRTIGFTWSADATVAEQAEGRRGRLQEVARAGPQSAGDLSGVRRVGRGEGALGARRGPSDPGRRPEGGARLGQPLPGPRRAREEIRAGRSVYRVLGEGRQGDAPNRSGSAGVSP